MRKILLLLALSLFTGFTVFAQSEGVLEALKFKDADIRVVLQAITQKAVKDNQRVNILVSPDVKGMVTVDLENVDWETALDAVLKTYDYGYEWTGKNIILVDTLDNLSKKREKMAKSKVEEPTDTKVFTLNFAKVEDVEKKIKGMVSARGKMISDNRTNILVVTDTQSNLKMLEDAIKAMDMITPQVRIEAKIVEADASLTKNIGVNWNIQAAASGSARPTSWPFKSNAGADASTDKTRYTSSGFPPLDMTPVLANKAGNLFSFGTLDASSLSAALAVILNDSHTEIKSEPQITTLDNQTATIEVVTKDPLPNYTYDTQSGSWVINGYTWIEYGVTLEVTPQINKEKFITLLVKPTVSELSGEKTFTSGGTGTSIQLPIIDSQTTTTKVMVKDGATLVIAGLIRDQVINSEFKVPVLGDIWVLDYLFKQKSKSVVKKNLMIFITPQIVTPDVNEPVEEKKVETK